MGKGLIPAIVPVMALTVTLAGCTAAGGSFCAVSSPLRLSSTRCRMPRRGRCWHTTARVRNCAGGGLSHA